MVNPITGPVEKIGGSLPATYSYKKGYRQKRPYTVSLPYEARYGNVEIDYYWGGSATNGAGWAPSQIIDFGLRDTICYERLMDKIRDSSTWAVNLAEINKSRSMINTRSVQLLRAARQLRQKNPILAWKELMHPTAMPPVSRKKSLSNQWLELHFGWEPLVKDIGNAVDALQKAIKTQYARAVVKTPETFWSINSTVNNPSAYYPDNVFTYHRVGWQGEAISSAGVSVAVTNPNLWLANQLGFLNPVGILWELTPFSFVVDWFSTVGTIIASYSDFYGLTVQNPWHSHTFKGIYTGNYAARYRWYEFDGQGNQFDVWSSTSRIFRQKFSTTQRMTDLIKPSLSVRNFKGLSLTRGATAIALLVQMMKSW